VAVRLSYDPTCWHCRDLRELGEFAVLNIRTFQSYHELMLVQHAVPGLDLNGMVLAVDGPAAK